MNFVFLFLLFLSSDQILCWGKEERKLEQGPNSPKKGFVRPLPAEFSPKTSGSPHFSSFLWDDEDGEEETKILVFEDESSSAEKDQNDDSVEIFSVENSDSVKTKRNSFAESNIETKGSTGHSSLPKAAALQSGPSNIPIAGGLSPHGRANLFSGFSFPRNPSCGMCSRERNLCQIISGIFTRSPLPYGYSLVTPIPSGVCNISILEIKPSKNFFALRRKDGAYALNGNWKIQAAGNYGISGTLFSYSSSDGTRGEKLEAPGPLLEPLDLMIIYQSPNPGIKYEYRVPIHDIRTQQNPQSRVLPVIPNHGGIGNTYNLDHNKFPQNIPSVPNSGGSTLHPGRTTVSGTNRASPQNPIFPQLPTSVIDNTKPVGTVNKWNQPFLPSGGINRVPLNSGHIAGNGIQPPNYGQGTGSSFPSHLTPSGSQLYNSGIGKIPETRFKHERFPGVLNTDPRTIPNRSLSYQGNASISSQGIKRPGISFSPRTTSSAVNGATSIKTINQIHKTRHKHGSRDIIPGPAVGGNGISPLSSSKDSSFPPGIHSRNPIKNINNKKAETSPRKQQKRRRKKGKKRRGKKRKNRFHWVFKGLSKCTRSCGGGNQTSFYSCERRRKGKVVADRFCEEAPKPKPKVLSCNLKPCPAKWVPGEWGECSVTCGIGVRTRPLLCKQEVSLSLTMMVPEGACLSPKEGNTTQICTLEECPSLEPKWKVGEWSKCSTECGIGTRRRHVTCIVMGSEVIENECLSLGPKPVEEESCDMGSCATNTWFFSDWSNECSNTCGDGTQSRTVTCITKAEDLTCPESLKPNETRTCVGHSGCGGRWFSSPWSECSVSCGSGIETRIATCLEMKKNRWVIVPEEKCRIDLKPSLTRECTLDSCMPEWYTSEWTECSVTCGGGGVQEREVKCLDSSLVTSPNCLNNTKPETHRPCGQETCQKEAPNHEEDALVHKQKTIQVKNNTITKTEKIGNDNIENNEINNKEMEEKLTQVDNKGKDDEVYDEEKVEDDDNQQTNELEVVHEIGSSINAIPDKDAQGDESVSDAEDESVNVNNEGGKGKETNENDYEYDNEGDDKNKKNKKNKTDETKINDQKTDSEITTNEIKQTCMDRIKNCHLVFRARLCRLKYYNKLCCLTCKGADR